MPNLAEYLEDGIVGLRCANPTYKSENDATYFFVTTRLAFHAATRSLMYRS
jgi:hypothetical protein